MSLAVAGAILKSCQRVGEWLRAGAESGSKDFFKANFIYQISAARNFYCICWFNFLRCAAFDKRSWQGSGVRELRGEKEGGVAAN